MEMMAQLSLNKMLECAAKLDVKVPDSLHKALQDYANESMCIGWLCKLSVPELTIGLDDAYTPIKHVPAFQEGGIRKPVTVGCKVACHHFPFLVGNKAYLVKSEVLL